MNKIKLMNNFIHALQHLGYTAMLLTTAFLSPKPLEALLFSLSSTVISRNSIEGRRDVCRSSSSCLSIIAIASRSHAYGPR